jgi:hypothetical protein
LCDIAAPAAAASPSGLDPGLNPGLGCGFAGGPAVTDIYSDVSIASVHVGDAAQVVKAATRCAPRPRPRRGRGVGRSCIPHDDHAVALFRFQAGGRARTLS